MSSAALAGESGPPSLAIPEIRDYQRVNAELIRLLDAGHRHVRLEGAEGQRLLVSGLSGSWTAIVEVLGRSGPELGANLDTPGLTVIARGSTADGVGSELRAGSIRVDGDAGDAAGFAMSGGLLVIRGSSGHRLGLMQSGGVMAVLGSTGRLSGDRRSGGVLFKISDRAGPYSERGVRGGISADWPGPSDDPARVAVEHLLSIVPGASHDSTL